MSGPKRIGFVHLAPFKAEDPGTGLRETVDLFRHAEDLGLDSGWLRTRHLQRGVSSPAVLFGAIATVTQRIGLGHAVIPLEFENPFRLAEDLATVDVLSGGRLQPGLSVHPPRYPDEVNDLVHGEGWRQERYDYSRIERLRELLRGAPVREPEAYEGFGGDIDSDRVEPHSPGLADRLWYGGGSLRSAAWAGSAGLRWLVSNISSTEEGVRDFAQAQRNQIDRYRASSADPAAARVAVARVVVPLDGATDGQRRRYREYVERRTLRTTQVHGRNTIIAPDLIGTTDELVEQIRADAAFQAADDHLFELPFEFERQDWEHILEQLATRVGPGLGWQPGANA